VINVLIREITNCLPLQNQTANEEEKTACNAIIRLRMQRAWEGILGLNCSRSLHAVCPLQIYRPLLFRILFLFRKYVRRNHDVSFVAAWPIARVALDRHTATTTNATAVRDG
jgi:hypothetical protein